VHYNLGNSLRGLGLLDEAIAAYRHTIALRPDYAKAHCNLSQTLLAVGDLRHGFEEYRWRWNSGNFREQRPIVSCAPWEGEPLAGKALLVYCEQGFGDCLQFIRYVRPLPAMAARVTVLAPPPLTGLFRSIPGIEFSVEYDDEAYDYHIPLMCLPRLFGTTLATIPADVPYLAADPGKVAHWARRLREYDGKVKVGLVWAGDPHKHDVDANAIDIRRSITLRHFAGLAGIAGVQFFSLQKGESSAQALDPPAGMRLVDMTADFHDFEDTAAFVTNLDLVVSVDTSVVHLAGALAKPVWVLSRFDGCWRWLNRREDSPWYPTARVFHQSAPGDWASVLQQVQGRLTALATETRPAIHTA